MNDETEYKDIIIFCSIIFFFKINTARLYSKSICFHLWYLSSSASQMENFMEPVEMVVFGRGGLVCKNIIQQIAIIVVFCVVIE